MCRPRDRCMPPIPGWVHAPIRYDPTSRFAGYMSGAAAGAGVRAVPAQLRLVLMLTLPIVVIVVGVTALGLGELGASYRTALPVRDLYIEVAAGRARDGAADQPRCSPAGCC